MFERKVYKELLEWKKDYCPKYACLLEGARRVGKTTIALEFAKNEFETYILVDFATISKTVLAIFEDISNLDLFFLQLQAETGVTLIEGKSVIIFDEVQLYPKARQAIKYLVKDGRYAYIETGSLISIKKNVKDIVIPSEEHKIQVHPMDYEEFLWAIGGNVNILKQIAEKEIVVGESTNCKLMRDFRIYMAVGGMPQAVDTYIRENNFDAVDKVKREIISLYMDDLKKIDKSGRLSSIYKSIPSQLALGKKKFVITAATGKQKTSKDDERIFDLIDSKMVLPCYRVSNPNISLVQTMELGTYKLYASDIGLFTTLLFNDNENGREDIYRKLLSDSLPADLGYIYENVVAQILTMKGHDLYYHTWEKQGSSHYYEIDFLLTEKTKLVAIEVKSSSVRNHKSIDAFKDKYGKTVGKRYLFSQKDISNEGSLMFRPIYMLQFMNI
jgi:hypothetical protein